MRYVQEGAERIRRDFVQPAQEKYREKISFVFEVLQECWNVVRVEKCNNAQEEVKLRYGGKS